MAKKKKRAMKAPGLSRLDRGIYYCLIACSCVTGLFLYPVIIGNLRQSVFRDTHILAQGNPGNVILIFFGMFIGGGFALFFDWMRRKRQPIFGKAGIQYGPPQWKSVYPLLSKQFLGHVSFRKKHLAIGVLCFFVFVFVVLFVTSLGLHPRECLYDDGSILVYNCFNEKTAEYSQGDVAGIRIYTQADRKRRGHKRWGIEMEISMNDGETFFFSHGDFQMRNEMIHGSITGMTQIKACFDLSIITLDGEGYLSSVVRDMDLNKQEEELLYLLFDVGQLPR